MSEEAPKKRAHKHKYTVTVSADSADEAIMIAAEALPKGATIVESHARSTGENMGFEVTLSFTGGDRRTNDPSA